MPLRNVTFFEADDGDPITSSDVEYGGDVELYERLSASQVGDCEMCGKPLREPAIQSRIDELEERLTQASRGRRVARGQG